MQSYPTVNRYMLGRRVDVPSVRDLLLSNLEAWRGLVESPSFRKELQTFMAQPAVATPQLPATGQVVKASDPFKSVLDFAAWRLRV